MLVSVEKAAGRFFTPLDLARILANWAIRSPFDEVLEPSCGEGVFLLASIERLRQLHATPGQVRGALWGVEKNRSGSLADLQSTNGNANEWFSNLIQTDFFEMAAPHSGLFGPGEVPAVDVVLGNPPYVRYQSFTGKLRENGLTRARERGVVLPRLASMWAPFLVHAAAFVRPEGRLAMVLPAELLHVQYASAVRAFLLREFARVCIIKFDQKIFPGALEEVVLLLADRQSPNPGLHVGQVRDVADLQERFETVVGGEGRSVANGAEKWSSYLLTRPALRAFQSLAGPDRFQPLGELASVDVGAVTGANSFFFLSPEQSQAHKIDSRHLKPAVAKAAHVAGCVFDHSAWSDLKRQNARCQLLLIDGTSPSSDKALRRYIQSGEEEGFHERYKCRIRSPWFALKRLPVADAFLCYMANAFPKIAYNELKVLNSNTIHSVRFHSADPNRIKAHVVAFYNSVTLLSCELFARSYGGGVLKIEPTEAEALLMPRLENGGLIERLSAMFPEVDLLLRDGQAEEAVARIDAVVLRQSFGASPTRLSAVSNALRDLRTRRLARSAE